MMMPKNPVTDATGQQPFTADNSPLARLIGQPWRFDFFQTVRLYSLLAVSQEPSLSGDKRHPVGRDWLPQDELVRFRADIGNTFSSSQISALKFPGQETALAGQSPIPELATTFLGLAGASGVLPGHYTQMLIDRTRARDFALREFLDLFNHRLISHYYRAWEKCHFFVGYEMARRDSSPGEDLFTRALYCLIGQGTGGLRDRQVIADETFLYYAGHFAHWPRTATALEKMIFDYLRVPVCIQQFQGQWLYLRLADQTRLSSDPFQSENNRLGMTAIAGERIWGIENKFRIRLGPLSYATFCKYMPDGDSFQAIGQLTRSYVGPGLDFDLQLVLDQSEIPACVIGQGEPARLGWNSWLYASPASDDVDDAVFGIEGLPDR